MEELIEAIKTSNLAKIEEVLKLNSSLANEAIAPQGISPLMLAVYYRNPVVIDAIRPFKKELNLHEACALGEIEIAKGLVEKEPHSINQFSNDGFTALGLACFFGHLEVVMLLISKGADVNIASNNSFKVAPIHSACAISNEGIVTLLLQNGADVNAKQQEDVTPLHEAANHGKTTLVQLLLEYGADIQAKTTKGQTPLQMAEEKQFTEVVTLIRSRA